MKKRILVGAAVLGVSVIIAGIGPVFAGGNEPQEHQTWQYEEALETGTLPPVMETDVRKSPQAGSDAPAIVSDPRSTESYAIDVDPRWMESGGE